MIPLINRIKEEHLTEDGYAAVISLKIKFLGLTLFENVFISTNLNVLGCFSPYYEQYTQTQIDTNDDYHRTNIGYKNDKKTTVPDNLGQIDRYKSSNNHNQA